MDKSNYLSITTGFSNAAAEKGFKYVNDGGIEYYSNGNRAFAIEYDEKNCVLQLKTAELAEGEAVEWKAISAWSFDEFTPDSDKTSIKNDFCDTMNSQLGLKSQTKIGIPSKNSKAETVDVATFTGRFLDIYPAHKDKYKANIEKYGSFMYDKFYSEVGTEELAAALSGTNKKLCSKLFELLNVGFVDGDNNCGTLAVYTIICGTLLSHPELEKEADIYMEKYNYLTKAVKHELKLLKSSSGKKYL